ncbi:hypothetical protein KA977_11030 [Candidatus Dependentiae bacterium]|nr:hypothetical protein [Candidatus Dependentiae bacterium]
MKTKYLELLTDKGLMFRETLFKEELLEFDMMTDEYKTISSREKYNFDFLKKYKLMTRILIAARNINPEDNANFFNNVSRIFNYNAIDQTIVIVTSETGFMKTYLKALNMEFKYIEIDHYENSTVPLLKAAGNAASPNTDFFLISFFNQEYVSFEMIEKLINKYETAANKSIAIPLKNGKYINPVIINRNIMDELKKYKLNSFTEFLKQYEGITEFVHLD